MENLVKYLWISVLVLSLGLVGCACKSASCVKSDKAGCSADARAGKVACDHEGPCTDECKTMHKEGAIMTCNHEGPCTDECKTNHMELGKAAHKHEGPCTDECKVVPMEDGKKVHDHEGPCTNACKVEPGETSTVEEKG
jgi:hypothetical protein